MKSVNTIAGPFNEDRYKRFQEAYKANDGYNTFKFEGETYLMSFAKYLLEYLSTQFPNHASKKIPGHSTHAHSRTENGRDYPAP